MKNIFKYGILAFAAIAAVSSCDWTDPEPVKVVHDGVADSNPDAYAKYLENLRAYRTNGHKKIYAWYQNKGSFTSQADRVSAVPDSIDVLVLHDPALVNQTALDDINKKRSETGMQMACTIDYNAIKAAWTAKKEVETSAAPVPEWTGFLADSLATALGYADNVGFNRVIAAFVSADPASMAPADKDAIAADQQTFFAAIQKWVSGGVDRAYDFMGVPRTMTDKSVLSGAGVIFLSETAGVSSTAEYDLCISRNSAAGVPTDRFAVVAPLPGVDANQNPVGTWGNDYTAWLAAKWSRGAEVKALGLTNLANDYYNPSFIYPVCRRAIQILNPAAK